ncbi:DUF1294 domain-containing protein [Pararhizobium sp. LjRoot238]|uniref:DUF1294 domain-containing protein n=1 Tax=Pararhizobium sp. LjRoot238 TaxID=3342293 RepID=UPI003ECC8654
MTQSLTVALIVLLINLIIFCVFWWDKDAARKGQWRVPESRLLCLALIGGSPGAVAAQRLLRHKTRKEPFRTQLMLICAMHVVGLVAWLSAPLWAPMALAAATALAR